MGDNVGIYFIERHSLEPLAQPSQRKFQRYPAWCWCVLKVITKLSPLTRWWNSVLTHALIARQVFTVDDGCKHVDLTDPGDAQVPTCTSRKLLAVGGHAQWPDHQLWLLGLVTRSGIDWTDMVGNGRRCSWGQRRPKLCRGKAASESGMSSVKDSIDMRTQVFSICG